MALIWAADSSDPAMSSAPAAVVPTWVGTADMKAMTSPRRRPGTTLNRALQAVEPMALTAIHCEPRTGTAVASPNDASHVAKPTK